MVYYIITIMPGRTREGARVSRLYKQRMADLAKGVKEDKVEKKVEDKKEKKEKKDKSKLDKVKEIFEE